MTKAEKNIIITKEGELWLDYQRTRWATALEHEKDEFPSCYAFDDWAHTESAEVKTALYMWSAVWQLLNSLGLQCNFDSKEHEIANIYQSDTREYFQK